MELDSDKPRDAVLARVHDAAGGRRILRRHALALAAELGLDATVIGQLCNQEGIKIRACQLGCF